MIVAELVQQPGREHLPYLTPCPKGRRQTWFNRSGNEISAWINNMMYSNFSKGYPTFTHFPAEDQEMWFRQVAQEFTWNPDHTNVIRDAFVHKVMDNYGKQIYEWKQKWIINQSLTVLSDSKVLISMVNAKESRPALFGILFNIYHFSSIFETICFMFIPHFENFEADYVASQFWL
uniref:Uncharacterized protein n=1 Tax=Brassica oleracea var. oleracea TaxID=109376 RepID=A0A0D3AC50_BRAOL